MSRGILVCVAATGIIAGCTSFARPLPSGKDEVASLSGGIAAAPPQSAVASDAAANQSLSSRERVDDKRASGVATVTGQNTALATLPMVIRTGQASIEVDSLELAIRRVGEIAIASGGYLANTSIQTGAQDPRSATLEVKLPSDRYQGTFDRLAEVGKVRSATTAAQDVGEEFVDVTARVTNAKKLEERLIHLLATRTGKLDDVLSVERELARVREEIERYEGRLRWLRTQVAMSTLTVTVFEPGPVVGGPGENVIVEALKQSWRNFVGVIAAGIAVAGGLVPVAVFGVGVLVLGRIWLRRFRKAPSAAA